MKKINLSKKKKRIIALSAAAVAVLSCAAAYFLRPVNIPEKPAYDANELMIKADGAKEMLSDISGNTLWVDEKTGAFYFYEAATEKTLDTFSGEAAEYGRGAALTLELTDKKGNGIILDSTDNSINYGTFEIEKTKNAVTFVYALFSSAEAAESNPENGFDAKIPLKITTENGNFKISADLKDAVLKDGFFIEKISLMPGLFAVNKDLPDNYYIIPDGSGCIAELSSRPNGESFVEFPVYNSDVGTGGEFQSGALVPFYSFGDKTSLATVIIDDGDAISSVHYDSYNDGTTMIYSDFAVTPVYRGEKSVKLGASYNGEVSLVLGFCKKGEGAYNDAAFFVREFFIKKGYLKDSLSESTGDLPFIITAIGSTDGKSSTLLTDCEQSEEILTLLSSKGVRNMYFRYTGALSGGLLQKDVSARGINKELGGNSGFSKLLKTAEDKNSKLFLEADVLATRSGARALSGTAVKAYTYPKLHSITKSYSEKKSLADPASFGDNTSALYKIASQLGGCNISANDISFILFSESDKTRQQAMEDAIKTASSLSAGGELMLSHPALYLMKYASVVSNVPTSYEKLDGSGLHAVPFLQTVLHGSVIYGCDYINNGDSWNALLKTVEYGGVPSFLFTYEECENLAYGTYASMTANYYSKVKSLKAITDMTLTSHEEIKTGVYKLVYNYNRIVYVNYTKSVAEVEGVLISPQDFLIV